jgi:hypothetical protein
MSYSFDALLNDQQFIHLTLAYLLSWYDIIYKEFLARKLLLRTKLLHKDYIRYLFIEHFFWYLQIFLTANIVFEHAFILYVLYIDVS